MRTENKKKKNETKRKAQRNGSAGHGLSCAMYLDLMNLGKAQKSVRLG